MTNWSLEKKKLATTETCFKAYPKKYRPTQDVIDIKVPSGIDRFETIQRKTYYKWYRYSTFSDQIHKNI